MRPALTLVIACVCLLTLAGPACAAALPGDPGEARPQTGSVRLIAVGDVMLGQSIGRRIVERGPDSPWRRVLGYFDEADLVMANLECAITTRGTRWPKDFNFRAPPAAAESLVAAGIDLVNVANNHALDYGIVGFRDTLAALDQYGIGHVGGGADAPAARAPLILVKNGLRIGFLGYVLSFAPEGGMHMRQWAAGAGTPGLAVATPEMVEHDVRALRPRVDVVVVTVHGGREYSHGPNQKMRDFTRAAMDAGAALVIGHHPHVLQGYHRSGGTLVAYSLGNFVFDYFTRPGTNDTAILDVTLTVAGVESMRWIPIVIVRGFPRPATGAEIPRIMSRLQPL